jgi:tetratricopeptide (TPR) repeat protein
VWKELASVAALVNRYDVATEAWQRVIELDPSSADAYLGAAEVFLKARRLDEARESAVQAVDAAGDNKTVLAAAHTTLVNVALAKHDADEARSQAELAHKADPSMPAAAYVDGRLLYDEGSYAEATPFFEEASAALRPARAVQIPELRYFTGDTLRRLDRYAESEYQLIEELRSVPHNVRARSSLALLYQATGRIDEAADVAADLVRVTPSPEAYSAAVRLWTMLGNRKLADSTRAESARLFAGTNAPKIANR